MKKTTAIISALAFALLASNAYWTYRFIDQGVTLAYQDREYDEAQQALLQARAIIKVQATRNAGRAEIIQAAQKAWSAGEPFEKDGYLWVGRVGLKFDDAGRLVDLQ
jgi:hypothetical protein